VVSKKCVSLRRRNVREPPTRADRDLEQVRSLAFGRSEIGGDELAEVLAFRDALRYEMDKSRPHWRSVTGLRALLAAGLPLVPQRQSGEE
jgi:hypothetical protein